MQNPMVGQNQPNTDHLQHSAKKTLSCLKKAFAVSMLLTVMMVIFAAVYVGNMWEVYMLYSVFGVYCIFAPALLFQKHCTIAKNGMGFRLFILFLIIVSDLALGLYLAYYEWNYDFFLSAGSWASIFFFSIMLNVDGIMLSIYVRTCIRLRAMETGTLYISSFGSRGYGAGYGGGYGYGYQQ
jgi:hypothetical protein